MPQSARPSLKPLSSDELDFIECVRRGVVYWPTKRKSAKTKDGVLATIQAGLIRNLLLGVRIDQGRGVEEPVPLTSAGIQIKRNDEGVGYVAIDGPLDLQYVSAAKDAMLSPLRLNYCLFRDIIDLEGGSFATLSLHGSRFCELWLNDATIDGILDVSNCGPIHKTAADPDRMGQYNQSDYWPFKGRLPQISSPETLDVTGGDGSPNQPKEEGTADDVPVLPFPSPNALSLCIVRMHNASINGSCDFSGSDLVSNKDACKSGAFGCSLSMTGAHITGSLYFLRMVAIGGINLRNIKVEEDVWFSGCRIFSYFRQYDRDPDFAIALNLQHAQLGGGLIFLADTKVYSGKQAYLNERRPFRMNIIIGMLGALGLRAQTVWIGGCWIWDLNLGLYFNDCQIQSSFVIGNFDAGNIGNETWFNGKCTLNYNKIGGKFMVNNAGMPNTGQLSLAEHLNLDNGFYRNILGLFVEPRDSANPADWKFARDAFAQIAMIGTSVDQSMAFSNVNLSAEPSTNLDLIAADRDSIRARSTALDLWKSGAAMGLDINAQCQFIGSVRLNRTEWGRSVVLRPRQIKALTSDGLALHAKNMVIHGDLVLGGTSQSAKSPVTQPNVTIVGRTDLGGCQIEGDCTVHYIALELPASPAHNTGPSAESREIDYPTLLSLESASISGELCVTGLQWRMPISEKGPSQTNPIDLMDHSSTINRLSFYPDAQLLERHYGHHVQRGVYFPNHPHVGENGLVLLNGISPPIHGINAIPGLLQLDSTQQRIDYLTFFCDNVHAEEGAFRVVTEIAPSLRKYADEADASDDRDRVISPRELGPARHVFPNEDLDKRADTETGWALEATILYGNTAFEAQFRLLPTGMVEMVDDKQLFELADPLALDKGMERVSRLPHGITPQPYYQPIPQRPSIKLWFRKQAAGPLQYLSTLFAPQPSGYTTQAFIDLRRMQCGFLNDDAGDGWGMNDALVLKLGGIKFDAVEWRSEVDTRAKLSRPKTPDSPSSSTPDIDGAQAVFKDAGIRKNHVVPKTPVEQRCEWLRYQFHHYQPKSGQDRLSQWIGLLWRAWLNTKVMRRIIPASWNSARDYAAEKFVPHTWDNFATAYLRVGEIKEGHELLSQRKEIGAWVHSRDSEKTLFSETEAWPAFAQPIVGALRWIYRVIFVRIPRLLIDRLFAIGFQYGLSSKRALITLLVILAIGALGTHKARTGAYVSTKTDWAALHTNTGSGGKELNPEIALVLQASYQSSSSEPVRNANVMTQTDPPTLPPSKKSMENPSPLPNPAVTGPATAVEGELVYAKSAACNLGVSSLLYAVDVFIPFLDLDQESRCTIREEPEGKSSYGYWRWAKVIYEILGWIITSLSILTFSGLLRRDMER